MKSVHALKCLFYLFAFLHFVLCPAVDHLYNTPGYAPVIKKEVRLQHKEGDQGMDGNRIKTLHPIPIGMNDLFVYPSCPARVPSPTPLCNHSVLLSVRLNL